jgi:hypothetical protein
MSNDLEKKDDDRLDELKADLSRHFGRFTRWRVLCEERGADTDEEKIRLAEEVLAVPSTGTNAEWLTHHLRLKGDKSFDVDEMMAGGPAAR